MRRTKIAALALASLLFFVPPLLAEGKVIILDYHTFLGNGKSNLDYTEQELAEQLDGIKAMGYKFVSLDDAIAGKIEGKANIVITIDDGNHTVYPAFKDVFEPRGIKPYLFVYPAIIKGHLRYALTPERLLLLAQAGCGVGAHGYHHNAVTDKTWARDPKDFMTEIKRPGPVLANILGAAPTMFAYPFGVYSRRAEDALAAAGYSWAFAANDKMSPVSFDDPALDHMAVHRTITYRYTRKALMSELRKYLAYDGPPLFEEPPPDFTAEGCLPGLVGPDFVGPDEVAR
jgi:peptidoglycan/xylan/chitin deacetylase (PgdA/CDA1 family)